MKNIDVPPEINRFPKRLGFVGTSGFTLRAVIGGAAAY
jgi:hypothetical protein